MKKFTDEELSLVLSAADAGQVGYFIDGKICLVQAALNEDRVFGEYASNAYAYDAWLRGDYLVNKRDVNVDTLLPFLEERGMA